MPIVIIQVQGTTGDYDPPCRFCYINMTKEHANQLCDAIEAVAWLKSSGPAPFRSLYAVETFANPAIPFIQVRGHDDLLIDEKSKSTDELKAIHDVELQDTLLDFMADNASEYFVMSTETSFRTDEDSIKLGTDTMLVKEDGVLFEFSCERSVGAGASAMLSYHQLAHWAGRITLPEPRRSLGYIAAGELDDTFPIPKRITHQ